MRVYKSVLFCNFVFIKAFRYIFISLVTVLMTLYLGFYLVTNLPSVQRFLGQRAGVVLSDELGSRVTIGSLDISFPIRPVLDSVTVLDQTGDTLIDASRLSARLRLGPLLDGMVSLAHIQLYRPEIHLRADTAGKLNCQYLIDLFKSDGDGDGGIGFETSTILLRRGRITYDSDSTHHELHDLAVSIYGLRSADKRFRAYLHDMHFRSGPYELSNLSARVENGPDGGKADRLSLSTVGSRIALDSVVWGAGFSTWRTYGGQLSLSASDLPPQVLANTTVRKVTDNIQWIDGRFAVHGTQKTLFVDSLHLTNDNLDVKTHCVVDFSPLKVDVVRLVAHWQRGETLDIEATGMYSRPVSRLVGSVSTAYASFDIDALLKDHDRWRFKCRSKRFQPSVLLSYIDEAKDIRRVIGDSASVTLDITSDGSIRNRAAHVAGSVACNSAPLVCDIQGTLSHNGYSGTMVDVKGTVPHIHLIDLGVKGRLAEHPYATSGEVNLHWKPRESIYDAMGHVYLSRLQVLDDTTSTAPLTQNLLVDINLASDNESKKLMVESDFMTAYGLYRGDPMRAVAEVRRQLSQSLPSLVKNDGRKDKGERSTVMFNAHVHDTRLINYLTDMEFDIKDKLSINFDNRDHAMFRISADGLAIDGEQLRDLLVRGEVTDERATTTVSLFRGDEPDAPKIELDATAAADTVGLTAAYTAYNDDGGIDTRNGGKILATAALGDTMRVALHESRFALGGTDWNVRRSTMSFLPDNALEIKRLAVESGDRHLYVTGRLSKDPADTLDVDLRRVNLAYIFDLVKFDDVEFDGDVTGLVKATGITSGPNAAGLLKVENFSFNKAVLGDMDLLAAWNTTVGQLDLDGHITGPGVPSKTVLGKTVPVDTRIVGRVNPIKRRPLYGLDLKVKTQGFNMGFVNEYLTGILDDLNGSFSGDVHIHGPFSAIAIEGGVVVDHCTAVVPTLKVGYQFAGDSLVVTPDCFSFKNIHLYDMHATTPGANHRMVTNCEIRHEYFSDFTYDLRGRADNVLGYDVREFGDDAFYGTAYLTGDVHLNGGPGRLDVDVSGTTQPGSILVYNTTTPALLTSKDFIPFVAPKSLRADTASSAKEVAYNSGTDVRLTFVVDVNPSATMRVLMDSRTGDYLEVHGTAAINAEYYNKGAFKMYGTYTVNDGKYRFTFPAPLHRDFKFRQGSTITFLGQPSRSLLDLKAYTTVKTNLNTLASKTTFSANNTDVDCVLNIGGTVDTPRLSFDFEIPKASQDDQAMVRSLVSTEEERTQQAIYLLGIGSFYLDESVDAADTGNMAISGFLSNTLNGQINSMLGDAMGKSNWTIGTNLSTGQAGWNEVQAEGSVSGSLFQNRLLLNGTFGYRTSARNPAQAGFVGDFDVQWLLTKKGTIRLKLYSQTADRYFIKSAMTTQGLGLVLKKDFNNLYELFNIKKKDKK